ncbi:DUF2147 domain-containing protein [Bradyrhizobium prioriisuperbiae]|uniref:DUF2147 domain-containing protein n=1 Tax=Bradyrhizobium prioriisuperbiae TaxID=2854389 RepID=UPI0028E39851|nr:DUF2147 domain-containing protein [Bradyrhizobium prioritasuperba]
MRIDVRPPAALAASFVLTAALLLTNAVGVAHAAPDASPAGVWVTQAGDAKVQVSRCGGALCGKVIWLRDPIDSATGKAQADNKNQNPALRTRPIIGIQLFMDMKPSAPNAWSGRIYNADDGQSYASTVTQIDAGRLEVKGCVGALCGSETWSRAAR